MRAMVYTAPLTLEMQDVDPPEAGSDDTIVAVETVGICGSDLEGFASQNGFRQPPLIMGHEIVGTRIDNGARVVVNPCVSCWACDLCLRGHPNLCRTREIIGIQRPGGFAEQVSVPVRNCYPLPEAMSPFSAVMVEPMANAVHAFRLVQRDEPLVERVGVIGAGMLGVAVALQAQLRGAGRVQLVDRSPSRCATARKAGIKEVSDQLEGEFDAVFDAVGSAATRRLAMDHLRPGGTSLWLGLHESEVGLDGREMVRTEKRVLATFGYHDVDYREAIRVLRDVDTSGWFQTHPFEDGVNAFREVMRETPPEIRTLLTF